MKKSRLGMVGLIASGAVLVLSSCGGGGSGDKRLTKEQFAAKANALCVSFSKDEKAAGNPSSLKQAIAYFEKLTPLYEKRVAGIGKLKPPASEETTVNRIVTLEKKEASLAKQLLAALKKNGVAQANTLIKAGNTNSKAAKVLYGKLGIAECAKSS